jgi:murein DD-endopeptidase MepM/ murein hydrolase activator NlpD
MAVLLTASVAFSSRQLPVAAPLLVTTAYFHRADTVHQNETLSHLLGRHNIYGAQLVDVVNAADGLNPRRIRPGQVFLFRYVHGEDTPNRITVRVGDFRYGDERILSIARDTASGWTGSSEDVAWSVEVMRAEGVVTSSMYEAVDDIISDSILPRGQRHYMVEDLADNVYGWVIDFYRDFYEGDQFAFAYERLTSQFGDVRFGRVLAAKIETRGSREHYAYVMTDERGRNTYYDDDGRSLRRSLKIRPVPLGRLISRYSRSRFHPVLKTHRPHYGIDYASRTGTPIESTGDGTVTRAGRWGTYGIMVAIRHNTGGLETRYAHMSRLGPGIRAGMRVEQGQTIGYVGMTGLASGPHVHYELLRNGKHIDPRTLGTEPGAPVSADRRGEFQAIKEQFGRLLHYGRSGLVSASVDR